MEVAVDFSKLTDEQVQNVKDNYARQKLFDRPEYSAAVLELQKRLGPELNIEKTIKFILSKAREGQFVTYGEVAEVNGCTWSKVRRKIPTHLDRVLEMAHARGAPYITANVVNQKNRDTGKLDPESLSGFIKGVERLGDRVDEPEGFLKRHQNQTFEYAKQNLFL